jgi:hypothetical protein
MLFLRIVSACSLLGVAVATQQASTLLARLSNDGRLAAPPAGGLDAVRVLDSNRDGQVTFDEVATFARTKGLNYASTLNEFAGLDKDKNGMLNTEELSGALGLDPVEAESASPVQAHRDLESAPGPAAAAAAASVPVAASVPSTPATSTSDEESDRLQRVNQRVTSLAEMASGLDLASRKEAEAQELEAKAEQLRARAKRLSLDATQRAMEAASNAAKAKADEFSKLLMDLEQKALVDEVRGSAMRAKASAELQEADDIMSVTEDGLGLGSAHVVEG